MNQPFERIQMGEMFLQMIQNGARHGLKLPGELFLLFRTLAEVEGLLRLLCLEFNVIAHCQAFAAEQQTEARQPARVVQAAGEEVQQWIDIARRLPGEVEKLVNTMSTGQFSIDFGRQGFDFLIGELDRSSNRIAVGLVIAALIMGSSFMLLAEKGPTMWGMHVIGPAMFAVGCILGLLLIWFVVKSGKY